MTNYDPNFTQSIKQWATYDSQIELLNRKLKDMRAKRDVLGDKLSTYIQKHNLTKTAFNFDNNRIVYKQEPKYSNLTYDFVYKCSQSYFGDTKKAQQFCQFIKSKRDKTFIPCLKRNNK
jgi:hypothetical protein